MDITLSNFEAEVLRADMPVALDCWASWCGPCRQYSPIFDKTSEEYAGVVKFAKLDTEAEPALSRALGIQALPTTLLFYKGQLANAVEGALPAPHLQQWLYQTLAVLRQYATQFDAESEEAITAAVQNLSLLGEDGTIAGEEPEAAVPPAPPAATQNPFTQSGLDPRNMSPKPSVSLDDTPGPGKRTASGLYIP